MADPVHVEWLYEGVAAWNTRRQRDNFRPALREVEIKDTDLRRANLSNADLRHALFERCRMWGADLQHADLRGARFRKVLFDARYDFSNSMKKPFVVAADVRTMFLSENMRWAGERMFATDLSGAEGVTQEMLNVMIGDRWTKIPEHLQRPTHWLEDGAWEGHPEPDEDEFDGRIVLPSNASLRQRLGINRTALPLAAQTALIEIAGLKERLARAHNQMDEDARKEMDAALDRLASHAETLGTAVPQEADISDAVVEKVDAERKGFAAAFMETMDKLLQRERLGEVGAPIALVGACATLGAVVGLNVATMLSADATNLLIAGGGLGLILGKMLTAEAKGGAGLKEAKDQFPSDEPDT